MEYDCLLCICAVDWVVDNNTPNGVGDSTSVPIKALSTKTWPLRKPIPTSANRPMARTPPRICQAGWPATELRWVPEHKGIEGNVVADQWATEGAGASGAERKRRASLRVPTSAGRGITKTKWNERLAWVKARCHGKRYYLLARAPKDRPGAKEHCHPLPPVSDQ
jgi:hypothetical protein